MSKRGFSCIGLDNPKTPSNVGSIMRAAGCYGSNSVYYTGDRYKKAKCFITDPQKNYRHIPLLHVEDLHDVIPFDCIPVAVDLIEGATSLVEYDHPERAFYIFGAEDNTLGKRVLSWCRDIVYVPTNNCMNLAAAVNVILYDRMSKQLKQKGKSCQTN
jgi:tRNA(Leu) C34 or U34 (ribose-2'-O)-methylase TrmL